MHPIYISNPIKKIQPAIILTFLCLFFSVVIFNSCSKSASAGGSSQVPYKTVNVSININTTGYTALATVGGVVDLANVGYRGIMCYRLNSTTIMAYDRTCTYNLSDNNGIIYAQNNGTAICLECNSTYLLSNGSVSAGPTTIALKSYKVAFDQTTGDVTVTN